MIIHESIETTLPKAKELVPYIEKLITKAKKGDLASRRAVIAGLQTVSSAHKLVDELAPKLKGRTSGHVRIERTRLRRGDNAQMAKVEFVEAKKAKKVTTDSTSLSAKPAETEVKNDDSKQSSAITKTASTTKISAKTASHKVAKRSGVRGNR